MNSDPLYVFTYGSLMWDPGFDFESWEYGLLEGYHRSPCIYSTIYRGIPKKPGLVFGLDEGGTCEGILYRVKAEKAEKALAYLRKREMPTGAPIYKEERLKVSTRQSVVQAVAFVANRDCIKYAGRLNDTRRAELIAQGRGQNGSCLEYFQNTIERLAQMGIHDDYLVTLTCRAEIFASRLKYAESMAEAV